MSDRRLFECETLESPSLVARASVPRPKKMLPPVVAVSKLKMIGALFKTKLSVPAIHRCLASESALRVQCSLQVDKAGAVSD